MIILCNRYLYWDIRSKTGKCYETEWYYGQLMLLTVHVLHALFDRQVLILNITN